MGGIFGGNSLDFYLVPIFLGIGLIFLIIGFILSLKILICRNFKNDKISEEEQQKRDKVMKTSRILGKTGLLISLATGIIFGLSILVLLISLLGM